MTADDKYSLLNRDNLTQPIRTQLSQKQKAEFFFSIFSCIFETVHVEKIPSKPFDRQHGKRVQTLLRSGEQHCYDFQKKDDPQSWSISEITHSTNIFVARSWFISEITHSKTSLDICPRSKGPFDRQHGKLVQTLLRSWEMHCYHIYWWFGR